MCSWGVPEGILAVSVYDSAISGIPRNSIEMQDFQDSWEIFRGSRGMREITKLCECWIIKCHCVVFIGRCMYDSQCFEANQWIPQKCAGDVGFHMDSQDFREIIWKLILTHETYRYVQIHGNTGECINY